VDGALHSDVETGINFTYEAETKHSPSSLWTRAMLSLYLVS